jgi:hypothetical protein
MECRRRRGAHLDGGRPAADRLRVECASIRDRVTVARSQRRAHHSWSYGQLRQFIEYECSLAGVACVVVVVDVHLAALPDVPLRKSSEPSHHGWVRLSRLRARRPDRRDAAVNRRAAVMRPYAERYPGSPTATHDRRPVGDQDGLRVRTSQNTAPTRAAAWLVLGRARRPVIGGERTSGPVTQRASEPAAVGPRRRSGAAVKRATKVLAVHHSARGVLSCRYRRLSCARTPTLGGRRRSSRLMPACKS